MSHEKPKDFIEEAIGFSAMEMEDWKNRLTT